jgi:nucleoside 2-deoxyribosyltransferase
MIRAKETSELPSRSGRRRIIYLAGPYTHIDPQIREERYDVVTSVAADLISKGYIVFSPLTMTHPIDKLLAAQHSTLGSDYWVTFDEAFMEFCSEIAVLMLDGWEKSSGVARELSYFRDKGRPVHWLKYDGAVDAGSLANV